MRVLIADDEASIRDTLVQLLSLEDIHGETAADGAQAKDMLQERAYDALVLDLRMPRLDGLQLLDWLQQEGPQVPTIVISAHGDVEDAVAAMKRGAYDYLVKPFEPDDLIVRLRRAVEDHRMRMAMRARPEEQLVEDTENAAMGAVYRLAARVAPSESTILVTGESGTGKEVLARHIHRLSARKDGPFVGVNLGAIPENLMESELFGYEKGAFTGASARKQGIIETAAGGTLFLDEIGDIPVHLQVKLLRILQERRLQRVGGTSLIPIDARIIAATNADLKAKIAAGTFREDLYYRLNVVELHLPPLRDRPEDVPALAAHFIRKINDRGGPGVDSVTPDAVRLLQEYSFPGNIRELENIIERAVLLADGSELAPRDFAFLGVGGASGSAGRASSAGRGGGGGEPATAGQSVGDVEPTATVGRISSAPWPGTRSGPRTLSDAESSAIRAALERNQFHREKTARELGISRRTLLNKIKEYGIETP